MIAIFMKIWRFATNEHGNIIKSIVLEFINAIFSMFEMIAIYLVISGILNNTVDSALIWICLAIIVAGIIGKIISSSCSKIKQTHAGFFMASDKRISIGEKIKRIPMGFFNASSLGNLTGICTSVLGDVEQTSCVALVCTLSGFITTIIFAAYIFVFDWRIGLIVLSTIILFLIITSCVQKNTEKAAPARQKSRASLVENMLEYIQGISTIKAFNLTRVDNKKVDIAIQESQKTNFNMEKAIIPFVFIQELVLKLGIVSIILAALTFFFNGSMSLIYSIMFIIMSFVIFAKLQSMGQGAAIMRVCSSSIDEACTVDSVKEIDCDGKDISPDNQTIEFKNVTFAYEDRKILDNVSVTIPDKTTTAIVGPSGSGKTTVCSLIARFWDVDDGKILIGNHDIKEYNLSSLLKQISIVFQDVYLFSDTIENNIKFGNPKATHEDVVQAAKKACCHEFISALPDGYNTIINSDISLSGGEKQRISIARAMLKNAPIIIFDEATANVDPENEKLLINAIQELTKNKTILMIAHRLKTVRNADQIIVLNEGHIVQQGKHEDLIKQEGIYANFVLGRTKADNWKLA